MTVEVVVEEEDEEDVAHRMDKAFLLVVSYSFLTKNGVGKKHEHDVLLVVNDHNIHRMKRQNLNILKRKPIRRIHNCMH